MYRPPDSDSDDYDDDYEGFSFGDESEKPTRATAFEVFHKELDLENQFHKFVVDGDLEELKQLLAATNHDVNAPLYKGFTLLHNAGRYGQLEIVKYLLENGANPNRQVDSTTPLMEACCCNTDASAAREIVDLLVKKGAVVNISDKYGMTPLMFACVHGLVDVVKILLPIAALESSDNQGWTAIFHAIENNHLAVVQLLVNAGADVNIPNRKGYTPRQVAQFHGFYDILAIMPEEEYQYFVPLTYLTYNSLRDFIPRLFLKSDVPEYFPEVNVALQQMRMERFLQNFAQNEINLDQFLTINAKQLEEIGIKFPFQRKKILLGILNFHLSNWSKKSIARVKRKDGDNFYDILMLIANQLKHLVIINSSIKYIHQNVEQNIFGSVDRSKTTAFKETLREYQETLAEIKSITKYLHSLNPDKPPLYIDYEEFVAKNKRSAIRKYIKYSFLVGLTLVFCYMRYK